jgi:hypothetical protein
LAISGLTMMLVASKCSSESESDGASLGGQSDPAMGADQPASEDTSVYNTEPSDMDSAPVDPSTEMPMPSDESASADDFTAPVDEGGSEGEMAPPVTEEPEGEMPVEDEGGTDY